MLSQTIESLGPGLWFSIHFDAKNAITDELKDAFERKIENLKNNFPCEKCKPHFIEFVNTHPLQLFRDLTSDTGEDVGFFKWSYIFHDMVNIRLNKKRPTYEDVYNFYYIFGNNCSSCQPDPSTESVETIYHKETEEKSSILLIKQPKKLNIIGRND